MDVDLYKIMREIIESKGSENTADIKYLGSISMNEQDKSGNVTITKDVIAMFDVTPDGNVIIKYYDENQNFIAGRGVDGELFPSAEYRNDDLAFLSEIDSLDESQGISLNELDEKLDQMAKILGISKEDILSMSEVDLDIAIGEKIGDDLSLSEDASSLTQEETEKQNSDALEGISKRQEISLDKKVDSKHTLAEILGVSAGSKLIVVNSDRIKNNDVSTRFSCIIQDPNGSLEKADMLKQVGGKNSSKNIYETNRDGSVVENKTVQSSFEIDSPLIEDGILTIRIGQMGIPEVAYGQMDRTSHNDAFTQRLETRESYPVTSRVRREFNQNKGRDNIPDKLDEIREHEDHGCERMTIDEADGNPYTGHVHSEEIAEVIMSDEEVGNKIQDAYTVKEVAERFEHMHDKHPDSTIQELIEMTKEELSLEADYLPGHEIGH